MKEAQAFLRELFGKDLAGNKIQLWCKGDKRSHYAPSYSEAAKLVKGTPPDWYVCVSLARKNYGVKKRAPANESAGIPGLWADIDVVGGPEQKKHAAPTIEAAADLARSVLEPTILINSGYGLQAWWLLDDGPWFLDDDTRERAMQMSKGWITLLRSKAEEQGWGVDATQDLARLMRVPDTVNGKGGGAEPVAGWPIPVKDQDGPRYSLDQLMGLALTAAPKAAQKSLTSAIENIEVKDNPNPPAMKLAAMLQNNRKFADTWRHERKDQPKWTNSEYDMSIAMFAMQNGWSDQEVAELIQAHRIERDKDDDKARRVDYLAVTIGKAKSLEHKEVKEQERAEAADELEMIAENGAGGDNPDHTIAMFNTLVGGPKIKSMDQYGEDNPKTARYALTLADGREVPLGGASTLLRQTKFQECVMVVTGVYLNHVKNPQWHAAIQALLDARTVHESSDDTRAGTIREVLREYKDRQTEDIDDAIANREPFIKDGCLYVYARNLATFMKLQNREPIPVQDVMDMLRAAGFNRPKSGVPYYKTVKGEKKRSTASYFYAPLEAIEE